MTGRTVLPNCDLCRSRHRHKRRVAHETPSGHRAGLRARSAVIPEAYVASAMDRNPRGVSPDAPLPEILPEFSGTRALVMDADNLVGQLRSESVLSFVLLWQSTCNKTRREGWR